MTRVVISSTTQVEVKLNHPCAPQVLLFAHAVQGLSKDLWRAGFLTCPDTCASDVPWRDCQCECDGDAARHMQPYDVLNAAGVLETLEYYDETGKAFVQVKDDNGVVSYQRANYGPDDAKRIYHHALKALCNPGHIGDMFQATSTNDPVFWLLHGNIDRIWHLKRLVSQTYKQGWNETWEPGHACYGRERGVRVSPRAREISR